MSTYRAFRVTKQEDGSFAQSIEELETDALPHGELLVDVHFSSLNYKDALSATGSPGVTRIYPHTPGIDAAGVVLESSSPEFQTGDEIVAIGFDLGMNTPGGFGQCIRIPAGWAVPLPQGLSLRESMILGTAGLTAALCVDKLEAFGMEPKAGPVLVTGATGGVGSISISLLTKLGYEVHAVTGKPDQHEFLRSLGARELISREEAGVESNRPLIRERWGGCVDTVGGRVLANALSALKYGASVAACGLVGGADLATTVYPFILRQVNLLGIDSAALPLEEKARLWIQLAGSWKPENLEDLATSLVLEDLYASIKDILSGKMVGRALVKVA